jgi:hypothetical protein
MESVMSDVVNARLGDFQWDLENVQRSLASLSGTISRLKAEAYDSASVQEAIRKMEDAVDSKVVPYGSHRQIAAAALAAKERYRKRLLEPAGSEK